MGAIPGFILKRFYVGGSLRNTAEGFEFALRNFIGTGTVLEVTGLDVDGTARPAHAIVLAMPDERAMKTASAGCSGTPLPQKLGLKSGMRFIALNAPPEIDVILAGAPELRRLARVASFDCALAFATTERALATAFAKLPSKLVDTGMIWIAWPKKTSGVATRLTEQDVRRAGLDTGLVDVKVCAIDATWSGLKFVRRRRDRRVK